MSQAKFAEYVRSTGHEPRGSCWVRQRQDGVPGPKADWHFPQQDDNHPVVCITRNEAEAYAEWLGAKLGARVRLPTAIEWEYAAKAGDQASTYAWGNQWPPSAGATNMADSSALVLRYDKGESTPAVEYTDGWVYSAPVGSTRPNRLGLYDMTGNVYEWVGDDCAVRGGSWDTGHSRMLKITARMKAATCSGRFAATGFRVVREVSN